MSHLGTNFSHLIGVLGLNYNTIYIRLLIKNLHKVGIYTVYSFCLGLILCRIDCMCKFQKTQIPHYSPARMNQYDPPTALNNSWIKISITYVVIDSKVRSVICGHFHLMSLGRLISLFILR